ncbi:MAG TPA: SUMF1/EgtB/PvdO family nonheme iron enzyme [Exilispira sp.]|nr:SUMF1/EgtB/PvdO family nonheme iron enzyme [Exilispira sp.]
MKMKKTIILFILTFLILIFLSDSSIDIITNFVKIDGANYIYSLDGKNYKIPSLYVQRTEITNKDCTELLNWAFLQGYLEISNKDVYSTYQGKFLIYILEEKYSDITFSKNAFSCKKGKENYPAAGFTWYGAAAIANFLSMQLGFIPVYNLMQGSITPKGNGFRLPHAYEWEFFFRGGTKSNNYQYAGSNLLDEVGWFEKNSSKRVQPIMQKKSNELGIYDLSGNLWEWCYDMGISAGAIVKGGAYDSKESFCIYSAFAEFEPLESLANVGFRLVRTY